MVIVYVINVILFYHPFATKKNVKDIVSVGCLVVAYDIVRFGISKVEGRLNHFNSTDAGYRNPI
jgi:hypothetical protein